MPAPVQGGPECLNRYHDQDGQDTGDQRDQDRHTGDPQHHPGHHREHGYDDGTDARAADRALRRGCRRAAVHRQGPIVSSGGLLRHGAQRPQLDGPAEGLVGFRLPALGAEQLRQLEVVRALVWVELNGGPQPTFRFPR
jgi:hypothetical protein